MSDNPRAADVDVDVNEDVDVDVSAAVAAEDGMNDGPAVAANTSVEDEGLAYLYESRLRRLRDYETRVYSRYNSAATTNSSDGAGEHIMPTTVESAWQTPIRSRLPARGTTGISERPGRRPTPAAHFYERPSAATRLDNHATVLRYATAKPPAVIRVDNDGTGSMDDDLTMSTGFNSQTNTLGTNSATIDSTKEEVNQQTPQQEEEYKRQSEQDLEQQQQQQSDHKSPTDDQDSVTKISAKEEIQHNSVAGDDDSQNSIHGEVHDENISECTTDLDKDDTKNKSYKSNDDQGDSVSNRSQDGEYSHAASGDSKYEAYALLVDQGQGDRAVEIPLYTNSRPHMRAFHYAWISFFIAFFNWFAITPLLSEVARSLHLSRKQIWTSSTLAVAGSAVTRILIGPFNDIYGARWSMCATLVISAIPSIIAGLVIQDAPSLYIVRLLIGVSGSSFVTCQYWTTSIFITEVAGTANSLTAGWGNLGGGVAQAVMGSLLFPLFKVIYGGRGYGDTASAPNDDDENLLIDATDRSADLAWRTVLVFPGIAALVMAIVCVRYSDDCPKGNFLSRKRWGLMESDESARGALTRGASNLNTWWLAIQYGCCFGVEITMTNAAALYFKEEFGQRTESAAAIASIFGWMNLFARSIGGLSSDIASAKYGMRGRLWVQSFSLLSEGCLVCLFSVTQSMAAAIIVMVIFSISVQAAEGSTFGIVPYVDRSATGSISGIVGAGGNVGGVIFALIFRQTDNRTALLYMGCAVLLSSFVSVLLVIPGHRGLLFGQDAAEVRLRRGRHSDQLGDVPNIDFHAHNNVDNSQGHNSCLRDPASDRRQIDVTQVTSEALASV